MEINADIQLVELELFDTAAPVPPGAEDETRRRFMTLFVHEGHGRRGGSAEVLLAMNALGERFALKRLHAHAAAGSCDAHCVSQPGDGPAPAHRKELRHSFSGSGQPTREGGSPTSAPAAETPLPDYVTKGHVAAFYEEYRTHVAVARLRGFPALYGFGLAFGAPIILMEWVEGVTLHDALLERAATSAGADVLPLETVAGLGIAIAELLESASNLQGGFVHRDLSPRNVMLRTDRTAAAEQLETGAFDLCLVDFGSAMAPAAADDPTFTASAGVWRMGTPAYAPPEMLTADVAVPPEMRQSTAIDVYALSSMLYELYAGKPPFDVNASNLSPYRLKTETSPALLEPRKPDGGAQASIILAGLSIQQEDRPSICQLRAALENWQKLPGRKHVGPFRGPKAADASFWQPEFASRTLTRRKLLSGAIVAVAALASAGIVGTAVVRGRQLALDASRYTRATAIYSGNPLYKAHDAQQGGWVFCTREGQIACKPPTSREPGAVRSGLAAVYDDISQRYGYITPVIDADAFAWAVLPEFARAGDFSEGFATAQDAQTGLWGYIDSSGSWAIAPKFHATCAFSNGVAAVQADGAQAKWGAIDVSGAQAIEPRFAALGSFSSQGFAVAEDPDASPGHVWGIVDADGNWVASTRFRLLRRMIDGLAPALDDSTGRWGFVDTSGSWALPPTFLDARPFSEGVAAVQDAKTQLWYFIDPDGTPHAAMKPRLWKLGDVHDGLAPAQATIQDDLVVFDDAEPDLYVEGVGKRYGYVDARGDWQMRRLTTLDDTAIGPAEI